MNILFIHQNFPGQFVHLAADLANDERHRVVALTINRLPVPAGIEVRPYSLLRTPGKDTHFLLSDQEKQVLCGEACAAAALQLKRDGFAPDIIVAHSGWGEALFIKDVFPKARLVIYCEYYYAAEGQDVGFDPADAPLNFSQRCRLRLKNTASLLSLEAADAAISPTEWQRGTYPAWAQDKISVIHEGIDLQQLRFNPAARLQLHGAGGPVAEFRPGHEVFSYVARGLEPVRGFHIFMRTLPEVLRRRPLAHAIIVGNDAISYGTAAPRGRSWREHMIAEVGGSLDMNRVHFVGNVSYESYLDLLNISRVHSYWTTPFVLSWSLLEAAATGMPVLASATPPVMEFADRLGIRMLDFFDHGGFADAIVEQMASPKRPRVAPHIPELDVAQCVQQQKALLGL